MQLSFAFLASMIASAAAVAIDGRVEVPIDRRHFLEIDICKDLGLKPGPTGGCTGITTANGGCYGDFALLNQDGGGWDNTVTSAVPLVDGQNFYCVLYEHPNCAGRALLLTGPAYDLREQQFDDIASSTRCYSV
ncbi:hypothetical protein CPB83DRAFT_886725 [Crepidotus variabilis]|uniref:Uncharacterized protein n=1 Tax=Crepidotus variabilis TaxID=179855 RepID=A0A9P6E720_9AGAR|nr:hypothetical protein CPB83DRAFT_886725 [Crepidotus variabilis]